MLKVMFPTQFSEHARVFSVAGSPVRVKLIGHYEDSGEFTLIPNGKVNVYEQIQSHSDSVDIHVIMKRYANGDIEALNRVQGMYGDFTNLPTSYAEMLNFLIARKEEFMKLPTETREKFGNDFNRYMATAGDADWIEKMGFVSEKPVEKVEKPVEKVGDGNE